jgi:hypothetical protein
MLTVGEIARRLSQPVHRIEYVLRTRAIEPTGRAGGCRVFSEADFGRIREVLAEIRSRKGGGE